MSTIEKGYSLPNYHAKFSNATEKSSEPGNKDTYSVMDASGYWSVRNGTLSIGGGDAEMHRLVLTSLASHQFETA